MFELTQAPPGGETVIATDKPPSGFELAPIPEVGPRSGAIKSWSFSVLMDFETCNYRAFLKSVRRLKQKENEFSSRGNHIHKLAEDFVNGEIEGLPNELIKFEKEFDEIMGRKANGDQILVEQEWAFTETWEPTQWRGSSAWARIKADLCAFESQKSVLIVDHKTGKKFGNELKHGQQLQFYVVSAFLMYPELEYVEAELWYLDHGIKTVKRYTRDEAMVFLPRWEERAIKMTTTTEFIPSPSKNNCLWCPYGRANGTGDCEWAA